MPIDNRERLRRLIDSLTRVYDSGKPIEYVNHLVYASTKDDDYADQIFHTATIIVGRK